MASGQGCPAAFAAMEELMRQRLGRECLYVPSCRLGLYVALRHWCPPGGRVLMSPVNDDVIFFVVLAAGLRPVQAPLRAEDGSIDLAAVPGSVWHGLSAVLTTNLYGNPDPAPELRARCDALGIPLIEDAAHAIGSEVAGQPVGSFGEASVFSLSKHTGAKTGGFLTVADPALRATLERARDELLQPKRLAAELAYGLRPYAEAGVRGLRLVGAARATLRLLGLEEREDIRMELRPGELKQAMSSAPVLGPACRIRPEQGAGSGACSCRPEDGSPPAEGGGRAQAERRRPTTTQQMCVPGHASPARSGRQALEDFHSWIRVDMHDYRLRPGGLRLRRTERLLTRLESRLAGHRAGTQLLSATEWALPLPGPAQPLFRVPLLVQERDAAIAALARRRITTGYLYDPPLDAYAGDVFTDPSPAPEAAAWFARHALPVDPLRAEAVISVLTELGARPAELPAAFGAGRAAGTAGGGPGSGTAAGRTARPHDDTDRAAGPHSRPADRRDPGADPPGRVGSDRDRATGRRDRDRG